MRIVRLVAVFALAFLYFFLTYHHYRAITLGVKGRARPDAKLTVYFASTAPDYTSFEKTVLDPLKNAIPASDGMADFSVEYILPHARITKVKLEADPAGGPVTITDIKAKLDASERTVEPRTLEAGSSIELDVSPLPAKTLHGGLVLFQAVVAALLALAVDLLAAFLSRFRRETLGESLRELFLAEKRWMFWFSFLLISFIHLLWLLAYWPGTTTHDSWASIYELRSLKLHDWHPYVYALYLMALMQFHDSIGPVGIFQILLTSAAFSYVYYYCYKRGVHAGVIVPFILLVAFSIPIGLFNTIIWKDVPFSIMVFIVSIVLYLAQRKRDDTGEYLNFSGKAAVWIFLGLILLLFARHNGVVYLLALPLLFFGRVSKKDYGLLLCMLIGGYLVVGKVIPKAFAIPVTKGSAYHELKTVLYIMTHYNYYSKNRAEDIKTVERFVGTDWEKITTLFPRQWFAINNHPEVSRHQFQHRDDDPTNITKPFLFRLMLENIPIVIAARTFEFFHSIGIDSPVYDARTNYFEDPLQLHGTNLAPPGQMIHNVAMSADSKLPDWVTQKFAAIDLWADTYDGPLSPSFIIWNLLVWFGLFAVIIFIERGNSAIVLFTLPALASTGAVFLAGAGESWRYFYYVYLCGLATVPLYAEYRKNRPRG